MKPWMYDGAEFDGTNLVPDKKDPKFLQGFVYCITSQIDGRSYIGKKNFWTPKRKSLVRGGRKKKILVPSEWPTYHGSSDELLQTIEKQGHENFDRCIIHLCRSKGEMSYWETYEIFSRKVLLQPTKYFNRWVSCKIRQSHLTALIEESNVSNSK